MSRIAATLAGFVFCLIYLLFLPFHAGGLALFIGLSALVIGLSALAMMLIGRPGDAVIAAITTAVLIALAAVTPHDAWEQPILRLADTVAGLVVGVHAAWLGRLLIRRPAAGRTEGVEPSRHPDS